MTKDVSVSTICIQEAQYLVVTARGTGDEGDNGKGVDTTWWEIQNNLLNTVAAERENKTENDQDKKGERALKLASGQQPLWLNWHRQWAGEIHTGAFANGQDVLRLSWLQTDSRWLTRRGTRRGRKEGESPLYFCLVVRVSGGVRKIDCSSRCTKHTKCRLTNHNCHDEH